MNVVHLMGGLGNQLFQYAFGQYVQEQTGYPVQYNKEWYAKPQFPPRPYILDKFNAYISLTNYRNTQLFREGPSFTNVCGVNDKYFWGYWQDPRYYSVLLLERLGNEFHVKEKFWTPEFIELYNQIRSQNAIAMHVRRGDYLSNYRHLVLPIKYYQKALMYIAMIKCEPEVYIFSDDVPWCKEHFEGCHFVQMEDYLEFELMRACKHFIIANSTFSWWPAFLSHEATIIAPNKWNKSRNNGAVLYEQKMLQGNWIKLKLS